MTCEEDKDCPKGREKLLQKKMSSSPLSSSLFPSSLSTLSAHNHGRSRNFCVSRKEQCLRVRAAKLPEGVNLYSLFPLFFFFVILYSLFPQNNISKQNKQPPAW